MTPKSLAQEIQQSSSLPQNNNSAAKETMAADTTHDDNLDKRDCSALGLFFHNFMVQGASAASQNSSASLPVLPLASSFTIVQDRCKGLERTHSLSFRRAEEKQQQRRRRRRKQRAHHLVSRWESYPQSHKEQGQRQQRRELIPQRKLSPTSSTTDIARHDVAAEERRKSVTREALHRALHEINQALGADDDEEEEEARHRQEDLAFTPCSAWLEVISKNDAFSPKPASRGALRVAATGSTSCSSGSSTTEEHTTANKKASCAPAHIPRRNSGETMVLLAAVQHQQRRSGGRAAKRAAALKRTCPPRRPQRQASLTNVDTSILSLEDRQQVETSTTSQRPRRHSDTPVTQQATSHHRRSSPRHSIPPITRPEEPLLDHVAADEEGTLQDASAAAKWKGICARSA